MTIIDIVKYKGWGGETITRLDIDDGFGGELHLYIPPTHFLARCGKKGKCIGALREPKGEK